MNSDIVQGLLCRTDEDGHDEDSREVSWACRSDELGPID